VACEKFSRNDSAEVSRGRQETDLRKAMAYEAGPKGSPKRESFMKIRQEFCQAENWMKIIYSKSLRFNEN
jgi:hypothetical protein